MEMKNNESGYKDSISFEDSEKQKKSAKFL